MKIDRATHLILDGIQCLARRPDLLAGNRHAADALGGTLDKPVEVGLAGGANHHDMVGAMPGCHAHASQVVLEAP